jgi:uncharacterized damage-inducible protein DinB
VAVSAPPTRDEAAPYYFRYIDRVGDGDIVARLESQMGEALGFFSAIPEEKSLHRYAPDKWSLRQLLNHVNDSERVFLSRAFWFARGFDTPLPSYDQEACVAAAKADSVSWADHVEDFRSVRLATVSFFRNLPEEAWARNGIASGNPFTVRALAYIIAGHLEHHRAVAEEKYF